MMEVLFKIDEFEGPLDLLLHLIRKNKVEITDIPIVLITQQYMEYLDKMKEFDMEITGDFLVMAAQLVYIKSKLLLPCEDEGEEDEDPRAELVDRLIEYAKYQDAVGFLKPRQEYGKYMFGKPPEHVDIPKTLPNGTRIPVTKLMDAFAAVMERQERKKPLTRKPFEEIVKRDSVPVSKCIKNIFHLFKFEAVMCFDDFFRHVATRAEAVSTFLAVLELLRRGNMTMEEKNDKLMCRLSGDESEFESVDSDY